MLQSLKIIKKESGREFKTVSGFGSVWFFIKGIGYVILLCYSTVFVAAIEPFTDTGFEVLVYILGCFFTLFLLIRFLKYLPKFSKYSKGVLQFDNNKLVFTKGETNTEFDIDKIESININLFQIIIIKSKETTLEIPLSMISGNKKILLSCFEDISEGNTQLFRKAYDFIEALLVAFILAMHIREYIIQAYFIPTGSMEDTLLIGDHLLAEKITYGPIIPKMFFMEKEIHLRFLGIRDIQRNDIIIFKPPNEEIKDYIKRCIALPGDTLNIRDGCIYVNGRKLDEPYTKGYTNYEGFRDRKVEGVVPEGYIAVFGDNRENSYDSRGFGYLEIGRVKGKAFVLYWNTKNVRNFDFARWGLIR